MKTPALHTGYHNAPLMRGFVLLVSGQSQRENRCFSGRAVVRTSARRDMLLCAVYLYS